MVWDLIASWNERRKRSGEVEEMKQSGQRTRWSFCTGSGFFVFCFITPVMNILHTSVAAVNCSSVTCLSFFPMIRM